MGSQDLITLRVMTLLAKVHFRQSNYGDALEVQFTIGRVTRELFGLIHPYISNAMMNIASVYVKQDQFGDAESLLEETLGDLTQTLGKLHLDTLLCMLKLAEIYS
ncbi:hypothetical protein HZ326_31619 [Fusarium oxysporum f. sp. albedinis]|nr:hypothetical protein HZ326_31619 [Fusarium oxysporum f. sp. albedinis]